MPRSRSPDRRHRSRSRDRKRRSRSRERRRSRSRDRGARRPRLDEAPSRSRHERSPGGHRDRERSDRNRSPEARHERNGSAGNRPASNTANGGQDGAAAPQSKEVQERLRRLEAWRAKQQEGGASTSAPAAAMAVAHEADACPGRATTCSPTAKPTIWMPWEQDGQGSAAEAEAPAARVWMPWEHEDTAAQPPSVPSAAQPHPAAPPSPAPSPPPADQPPSFGTAMAARKARAAQDELRDMLIRTGTVSVFLGWLSLLQA